MIKKIIYLSAACCILSGCGDTAGSGGDTGDDDGGDSGGSAWALPGTDAPSASKSILRREAEDGSGNGMIRSPAYDEASDTFYVDNLAFDGANVYNRDNQVASLGPFALYENTATVTDPVNGTPIPQLQHKALLAFSQSGQTEFAIVRTGGFQEYGFGGFVYQRHNGVTIPETGQASYSGSYAAIRDFKGTGGLEYVTADARVAIDFEDYNEGDGVMGTIHNRRILAPNGIDITQAYIDALEVEYETTLAALPAIEFFIGPGVADKNGEMTGNASSLIGNETFESGKFYAVLSNGADNDIVAEEIVGVIVVESDSPTVDDVTIRETGGFLVSR